MFGYYFNLAMLNLKRNKVLTALMVLTYGLNLLLMLHYELGHLPAWYFPVGAVTLWVISQIAVLGPALRASNVPPVVATRSV